MSTGLGAASLRQKGWAGGCGGDEAAGTAAGRGPHRAGAAQLALQLLQLRADGTTRLCFVSTHAGLDLGMFTTDLASTPVHVVQWGFLG